MRPMLRATLVRQVLFDALAVQALTLSVACRQLPADDNIWHYESIGEPYPGKNRPAARASIVPDRWLVVPKGPGATDSTAFLRCVLETVVRPPSVQASNPAAELAWEARDAGALSKVACAYTCVSSDREEVRIARL